ncbi:MAG: NAD(P)H-dependent oxidoreductase subunit E [Spirochaetaceae bacterium]|nr:MAG: NAD(P)H-dependent oxidoreductase subunit E [Spirochaetaceae bacterium]
MAVAVPERAELADELAKFIDDWKEKPGNLIMVLHRTQLEYGYLPEPVVIEVARRLGHPAAKAFGVATFYNYFKLTPPGRNRVAVCIGTACYLKGASELTDTFCGQLDVELNGVTEDKEFSIEGVRCVGCCGLAPVVMVNGEVHGKLTSDGVQRVIDKYRNGRENPEQAAG